MEVEVARLTIKIKKERTAKDPIKKMNINQYIYILIIALVVKS